MAPETPWKTFQEFFEYLESIPGETCFVFKDAGKTWNKISRAQFTRCVREYTRLLTAHYAVETGDRILLICRNRPEWICADLAIRLAGGISVALITGVGERDLQEIIQNAQPHFGIFETQNPQIEGIAKRHAENFVALPLPQLDGQEKAESCVEFIATPNPERISTIVYTSGTTGLPKGVAFSDESFLATVFACTKLFKVESEDVLLSFLPLGHIFQKVVDYAALARGATIAHLLRPDGALIMEALRSARPTVMTVVPRLAEKIHAKALAEIAKRPKIIKPVVRRMALRAAREKMQSLRFIISGGAALRRDTERFFKKLGIPILQGYGTTESCGPATCNTLQHSMAGSCGKPLYGVKIRIADDGEIQMKSRGFAKGYWKKEETPLDEDGWLKTGDVGRTHKDGYLFITGRKKDFIVLSTGKKVSPELVESELSRAPSIAQIVLVGEGKPYLGALVYPADPQRTPKEQKERIRKDLEEYSKTLSPHEQVRVFAILEKPLSVKNNEVTPTLKFRRAIIHQRHRKLIEGMFKNKGKKK